MLDGLTLERRGIPAAVVCTDAFEVTGRAMAEVQGAPDYQFAIIPHPISNLTDEQMKLRANEAAPDVLKLLFERQSPAQSQRAPAR
ncbi:MAG: hypothetical protein HY329_18815 [Chloroflexi bacterium]|nr:hypothetical protein [Chloroflexota bacterium]